MNKTAFNHFGIFLSVFRNFPMLVVLTFICMMCSYDGEARSPLTDYPFTSPLFEKVSHDNNIVNDIVTVGMEASNGVIWLGTQNGLISYDGYQFTSYVHTPGDDNSIPGNYLVGIGEQKNGDIWIATRSAGLAKFDLISRKFTTFSKENKNKNIITSNTLRSLLVASDDSIWIGSDHGVDHLSYDGTLIETYYLPSHRKGIVYSIFEDSNQQIFIGGTFGVATLDNSSLKIINQLSHLNVRGFTTDSKGNFWLSTHKGIYIWDGHLNLSLPKGIDPKTNNAYFRKIIITKSGSVWAATYGSGLWLFDEKQQTFLRKFVNDPSDNSSLAFNDIGWIFTDSKENLWVGMWGGGLQRLNLHAASFFATIRSSAKRNDVLSFSNTRSFLELDNNIWLIGSSGTGIDIVDPQKGKIGNISNDQTGENLSYVVAMAQDSSGQVWAGSQTNGLYLLDLVNQTANKINIQGLLAQSIFRLLKLKNGEIAVGTSKEVCMLDTTNLHCKTVLLENGEALLDSTTNLFEDSYGNLWVGTHKGLFRKKENDYTFLEISTSNSNLDNNYIHGIIESNNRLLTVTTTGLNAITNYNTSTPYVENISNRFHFGNGRPGGNMLFDSNGRLWSATSLLDFETKILHFIGTKEGIDIGTLWLGAYLKLKNGDFLFGGTKGVLVARPNKYIPKQQESQIIVRNLLVNGVKHDLPKRNLIKLKPGNNNISIQVAAIDPINRKQIKYKYRIKELSDSWQELDETSRWIGLTNLDAIEHNIEVSATYGDEHGKINPYVLKVVVEPTFVQTNFFKTIAFLFLLSVLYCFYKLRVRHLKSRAIELEKLVNQKSNELVAINNIGKEFTKHLSLSEVFEEIYNQITAILKADSFGIGMVNTEENTLVFEYAIENRVRFKPYKRSLKNINQVAVYSVIHSETILVNDYDSEFMRFSDTQDTSQQILNDGSKSQKVNSMIYVPIIIQGKSIGVLGLLSFKSFAFSKEDAMIMETLTSYAAVALNNAKAHEELINLHHKLETNIKTLRETQDKLIMKEKMASLGQLVGGVAHEVNTPLGVAITAISVMEERLTVLTDLVEKNKLKKSDLEDFLSSSKTSIQLVLPNLQKTANLVQQFKRVAATNTNNIPELITLPNLYIDIVGVINNTNDVKASINILNEEKITFHSFPSQLIQVITILVENALYHAFNGVETPHININFYKKQGYVVTTVEDNGVGIPTDVLDKIFEPFYTTKRKFGATGLGLSIAFNTVEQELKGNLSCTSTLGKGSLFTLRLPISVVS